MLCYTGEPRNSGTNNWDITKKHIDGDPHVFDCFERIRDTAATMRTALTRGDWDGVGSAIAGEWENRKRLSPGVTTPGIDDLITRAPRLARRRPKSAARAAAAVCSAMALPTVGPTSLRRLAPAEPDPGLLLRAARAAAWITGPRSDTR